MAQASLLESAIHQYLARVSTCSLDNSSPCCKAIPVPEFFPPWTGCLGEALVTTSNVALQN